MSDLRSHLPSVEQLLQTKQGEEFITHYGRALTLYQVRGVLEKYRTISINRSFLEELSHEAILEEVKHQLDRFTSNNLQPVLNATGVMLHTNLGRAPLSQVSIHAMESVAGGFTNLEFNLESGKRGARHVQVENYFQVLLGTEAVHVVNNNAAAVLLVLSALASRKRVIIARSQLVEIGGGFRVPEIMKQSGAKLIEIGTTNRVRLSDYTQALEEGPGFVMRVHRSNFKISGFTDEPELQEIAEVARNAGSWLIDDLGSGALLNTEKYGLAHEPTVQESLKAGVDLVCFSGDKLLGGPQSGIIVGRKDLIEKIRKHPLARTFRVEKMCLAALSATILHYLRDEALQEIPIWKMISASPDQIKQRALHWLEIIKQGELIAGHSMIGGGSLPEESLPTWLLAISSDRPDKLLARLRSGNAPIIARTEHDKVLFDPRTILPEDEPLFLRGIKNALDLN